MDFSEIQPKIKALQEAVKDLAEEDDKFNEDIYLLQWLQCRNMNIKDTEEMIRKVVLWRRENGFLSKNLKEELNPPRLASVLPYNFEAKCKDGAPVLVLGMNLSEIVAAADEFGKNIVSRYFIRMYLEAENVLLDFYRSLNDGNPAKLTTKSVRAIQMYVDMVQILTKFFPKILDTACFINCNTMSSATLKFVKPYLEKRSNRIVVCGTDKIACQEALLEFMEKEEISKVLDD